MPPSPKVSVLMTTFNHAAYIGEAMASVLGQDEGDFELLVMDDGSTDGTFEAAEQTAFGDDRVLLHRQDNKGACAAANALAKKARGEFIVLLDGDDVLEPDALTQGLGDLQSKPHALASFGFIDCIDAFSLPHVDGEAFSSSINQERSNDELNQLLLTKNCLSGIGSMIRRSALSSGADLFHHDLKYAHEYDLWLRLLSHGDLSVSPQVRGRFRVHGQNMGLNPEIREIAMAETLCCLDVHAPRVIAKHPVLEQAWPQINASLGALAFSYGNIQLASNYLASAYKEGPLSHEHSLMLLQCLLALNLKKAAHELADTIEPNFNEMSDAHQNMFLATKDVLKERKDKTSPSPS